MEDVIFGRQVLFPCFFFDIDIFIFALKLTNKDVVNELGGLPPVKLHCSVLAEEAIHEAIADYYRKQGKYSEEEIKKICNLKEHKCEHCG